MAVFQPLTATTYPHFVVAFKVELLGLGDPGKLIQLFLENDGQGVVMPDDIELSDWLLLNYKHYMAALDVRRDNSRRSSLFVSKISDSEDSISAADAFVELESKERLLEIGNGI